MLRCKEIVFRFHNDRFGISFWGVSPSRMLNKVIKITIIYILMSNFMFWTSALWKNKPHLLKNALRHSRSVAFHFRTFVNHVTSLRSSRRLPSQMQMVRIRAVVKIVIWARLQSDSETTPRNVWKVRKPTYESMQTETHSMQTTSTETLKFTQSLSTFGIAMCPTSVSVPEGGVRETEAAAWLDTISFCNGFCQWVDDEEWSIDSLPADSQQPGESNRASEAVNEQPSAEKSPTGETIINS